MSALAGHISEQIYKSGKIRRAAGNEVTFTRALISSNRQHLISKTGTFAVAMDAVDSDGARS